MKIFVYAAIAAAIGAPVSSVAKANHDLTVVAPPTVSEWSSRVGTTLRHNLRDAVNPGLSGDRVQSGLVVVRFKCSENGRPTAITFAQRSSNFLLNDIARRTVAGVRSMHPLPAGFGEDRTYEAVINLGDNQQQVDEQMTRYRTARATLPDEPALAIFVTAASRSSLKG